MLRNLKYPIALLVLSDEVEYSRRTFAENPITQTLALPFDAVQSSCATLRAKDDQLRSDLLAGNSAIHWANLPLNAFVIDLAGRLLAITRNKRTLAPYTTFFGLLAPGRFQRQKFEVKLATMRGWPAMLAASGFPTLVAAAADLAPLIPNADAAVAKKTAAEQAIAQFEIGPRKALVDQANVVRQDAHGKAAQMPGAHPELNLPPTFADMFFLHDSKGAVTLSKLDAQLTTAQTKVTKLTTKKGDVVAKKARGTTKKSAVVVAHTKVEQTAKDLAEARRQHNAAKKAEQAAKNEKV